MCKIKLIPVLMGLWFLSGCTTYEYSWTICYYNPTWGPDGKIYYFKCFIVVRDVNEPFSAGRTEVSYTWYIGRCNPDGSDSTTLVEIAHEDFGDHWPWPSYGIMDISPSGKILFTTRGGIYMVDTTGENLHKILDWGTMPRWAFNYTKIIFEGNKEHPGIWLMNPDGSSIERILEEGHRPAFCDANKKIAYHIDYWLLTYSFEDSTIDTLTDIYVRTYADWNNRGDSLVYLYCASSYIYDFKTDTSILLAEGTEFPAWIIRWQPGNKILGGQGNIWMISPDGREKQVILSATGGEGEKP